MVKKGDEELIMSQNDRQRTTKQNIRIENNTIKILHNNE